MPMATERNDATPSSRGLKRLVDYNSGGGHPALVVTVLQGRIPEPDAGLKIPAVTRRHRHAARTRNGRDLTIGLTTKATGDCFEALEPIHQGVREHFACCAHLPGRGHPGGENLPYSARLRYLGTITT